MPVYHKLDADGDNDGSVPNHLNFGKFLFENIQLGGNEEALHNITTNEKYTFKELTQESVNLSAGFTKLGMGKGDVVMLGIDAIAYVPTLLAVIFTGASVSPIYSQIGKAVLKHRLKTITPTFIICDKRFWNKFGDILDDVKNVKAIITSDDISKSAIPMKSLLDCHYDMNDFEPAEVEGQDVAVIYCSSGTTGMPKSVQLTHINCLYHCLANDYNSFNTGIFCKSWGINYYDFKTFMFLAHRKKMIHLETYSKEILLRAVEKYKIDIIFCNTMMVYELANMKSVKSYDLRSLKIIHSRSAPLQADVINRIYEIFPSHVQVVQAYGMTECGEVASEIRVLNEPKGLKHGSVGIPSRGIILKVINPQTGERLPPNIKGEICVKGDGFMRGYMGIDPSSYLDSEGFFRTSDLGYCDDDGYFYVIDRLNDIAPAVLENMLQLLPGVKEAGVVGRPHPAFGDLPTAFVVKEPGSEVTEHEIMEYIFKEVGPATQLEGGVKFISMLPRNERGKILRRELKEIMV
ncbi:hypothetical protein O0L34_g8742 [Tuta absoluta]|nr:hypothetical protein O0L34_g8742 [Tuta absoluta]